MHTVYNPSNLMLYDRETLTAATQIEKKHIISIL